MKNYKNDTWGDLHNKRGRPRKYTFNSMGVGEKQFFALDDDNIHGLQSRLLTSAKKHGSFKTKRVFSQGALGVVVERISDVA